MQGNPNKRQATDQEGKSIKKIRPSEDDVPVATITIPKSSNSHAPSNSLSINQLLTPNNPFSTPLTSYLLSNEEKDDKDPSKRETEGQLVARPPSPSEAHYYKQAQHPQQQDSRYYLHQASMPQDYHRRTSVEFLTQAQQQAQAQQEYLPKINFSNGQSQTANTQYIQTSPPTKFRPPSPITSSHQQPYPPQSDAYSRAHLFHYHSQVPNANYNNRMQYSASPQQTMQVQSQPQMQQYQPLPQQQQQSVSSSPVVLRWVMEYDKPNKK